MTKYVVCGALADDGDPASYVPAAETFARTPAGVRRDECLFFETEGPSGYPRWNALAARVRGAGLDPDGVAFVWPSRDGLAYSHPKDGSRPADGWPWEAERG